MSGRRARLDSELVRRGLASSRTDARRLIETGRVTVGGAPAGKASTLVTPADAVAVASEGRPYASRGGAKLAGALDELEVAVEGRACLDAGASTGGFTDVLLRRGAARVVAVDVGYGQLAWELRTDPRVEVLDRTNVRNLTPDAVGSPAPDLVVADLSFISLTLVLPALRAAAAPEADFVLLCKPQFEAGRDRVGKGGVVRDPGAWADAMRRVVVRAAELGLGLAGAVPSRLPGPAGNIEFFLHLQERRPWCDVDEAIRRAIADASVE
jgi:23S rRNA (cytidine1920-2'-O)/16S rRNA (cytidine1409-2'-O)-methyltransferase